MLSWHRQHHPLMEPQDEVKLIFQAMLGCGHLLGPEEQVTTRIAAEEASLMPAADEPLTEPLGLDYVRLNLRRAMAEGLTPLWIARLMQLSLPANPPIRTDVVDAIASLTSADAAAIARRLVEEPDWLPSHTAAYHAAYAPAYRVISKRCALALPVLIQLAKLGDERTLLCIDGPCGSGKSSLAAILQKVTDAALIPMDDFFLPHPRKTPERLSQPGGNADHERLVEEVLTPWLARKPVSYRPYRCHDDDLGEPIAVPERSLTIIEGSYSLLPTIGRYADLRVFLQISPETQRQRILARNGEAMLRMFETRWIPLEQAYFDAYGLPDGSCLVLQSM